MKINTRDFGWNDIDDEFFLLDSNLGKYYWLNRTAKDIWDILMESECENGDFEEVKKKL